MPTGKVIEYEFLRKTKLRIQKNGFSFTEIVIIAIYVHNDRILQENFSVNGNDPFHRNVRLYNCLF